MPKCNFYFWLRIKVKASPNRNVSFLTSSIDYFLCILPLSSNRLLSLILSCPISSHSEYIIIS